MDLEAQIREQRERIKQLEELVKLQLEMIEKLRAELAGRNSSTSHSPPSQDSPKQRAVRRDKRKKKRKASNLKRGAQPGHPLHTRQLAPPERVDELIICVPDACSGCGEALSGPPSKVRRHQVWEIPPPRPHLTEYRICDFECSCGCVTRAKLPEGVSTSAFGPRLHAITASLRVDARLSVHKTRDALRELFGVSLSAGTVSAIDKRVSKALAKDYEKLHEAVQAAPVVHFDETSWFLAGERRVLWGAVSKDATLLMIRDTRSTKMAKELAGEDFAGIAVTDRYCAYHWIDNSKRQVCWAHLRRDFAAMGIQWGMMGQCGRLLEAHARDILGEWAKVRKGLMTRSEYEVWARERKTGVETLLKQAAAARRPRKHAGVARETLKYIECLWTFIEHEGVEPTNNTAERTLRHPVIARKLSFGSQSDRGLRFIERMMSVRATLLQQGRSLLDFLVARLSGHHVDLLPA